MTSAVAHRLDSIKHRAGVRSREIAELLDTTPQTVSRWQQGRVDPQPAKLHQLLALEWLATQLAEFYEPDDARLWLYSPHKLLAGRRPAELIAEGDIDSVLALIDQLRDGAYV
jgi:transcriptional regulator with XRE-family HTH domain